MKIPLQKAFKILEDASAVIINDDTLIYPSLSDLTGEDDNRFLYLEWEEEGLEYNLKFNEGDNQEVEIIGSCMFLYDTDSECSATDHTQLTILVPQNLQIKLLEERL